MTEQQHQIPRTIPAISELASKFGITLVIPALQEDLAKSYLIQHREVGMVLAAVLVAEDERVQQHLLISKADGEARKDMSAAELKLLPEARLPLSQEETYAPVSRVKEIVQSTIKWSSDPLKKAVSAGLITDVLRHDGSGDSYIVGYRIPPKRRDEVISLLLKWDNTKE